MRYHNSFNAERLTSPGCYNQPYIHTHNKSSVFGGQIRQAGGEAAARRTHLSRVERGTVLLEPHVPLAAGISSSLRMPPAASVHTLQRQSSDDEQRRDRMSWETLPVGEYQDRSERSFRTAGTARGPARPPYAVDAVRCSAGSVRGPGV